ncbi:hypothetical protein HGRIS_011585 [Hohenbuehelia grisea]|uniref:Malate dehydrogenase n=1 Tax=Hohenbuehelia grisea TaxID=104357 RepID=A0ABR3JXK6_9AGAR
MKFSFSVISALWATAAMAVPSPQLSGCDLSNAPLDLPQGQTALPLPAAPLSFVGVAIGTQNYTCSAAGTFASAGALAELFDISCLSGSPAFSSIQKDLYSLWKLAPSSVSTSQIINLLHLAKTPAILGQHYFVPNPSGAAGLSPKWDFTSQGSTRGNPDAFVVGARVGGLAAPTGPSDIDWLALTNVQGKLASQVYRVDTVGGQPPASCTPGSAPITVKYTSKYYLFGSSL